MEVRRRATNQSTDSLSQLDRIRCRRVEPEIAVTPADTKWRRAGVSLIDAAARRASVDRDNAVPDSPNAGKFTGTVATARDKPSTASCSPEVNITGAAEANEGTASSATAAPATTAESRANLRRVRKKAELWPSN